LGSSASQPQALRIKFHPAVVRDVDEAFQRYESVSQALAEAFETELRQLIKIAAKNSGRFHLVKPGLHRANLKRFPYHFIYVKEPEGIRVMLVRHHRRHPNYGMNRE
jgi:plasmid stabilization system protein ParE